MSGLCGWISFTKPDSYSPEVLEKMLGRLKQPGSNLTKTGMTPVGGVAGAHWKRTPAVYQNDQDFAAATGHPIFIHAKWAAIAESKGFTAALVEGYRALGAEILTEIHGHFAVVVSLGDEKRAMVAVDRMASQSMTVTYSGGCLVFASRHDVLRQHPSTPRTLNPQAIYNYLYFHFIPGPESVVQDVEQLLPGGVAELVNNNLTVKHYWQLRYSDEKRCSKVSDYKAELRQVLRKSVEREADGTDVGAFLSGGTDSSTVSGMLGEVTERPAKTFSIGFEAQGYDEMEYARIAARHFMTEHHEYYVTPQDIVDAVPKVGAFYAQPFGNSSAVPAYYCAKLAREHGVTKLLAGDGGDELFAGNTRYVRQMVFDQYFRIPQLVRQGVLEPLFCHKWMNKIPIAKKVNRYIEQARMPMPDRMESHNLLEHLGIRNIFTPDFVALVNPEAPHELSRCVYNAANAETMLNRMLAIDYKFTLADNDLVKVNGSCELASMEVAFPLLSDEMVAFAARLPVNLKIRHFRLRYFFKEALRDFLPHEIITKSKHGFGLPVGPWMVSHAPLKNLARDNLYSLAKRGIVQEQFIKRLLDDYLPSHPPYFGTMAWILLMLEQWYQHHGNDISGP